MRRLILVILPLTALMLAGCGSTDSQTTAATSDKSGGNSSAVADVVGKYKTDPTMIPNIKPKDTKQAMALEAAKNATLELKADKTFVLTITAPFEGTYEVSGTNLTLNVTKMLGMSMDDAKKMIEAQGQPASAVDKMKSMPFRIEDGGKKIVGGDPSSGQGQLTFVRE